MSKTEQQRAQVLPQVQAGRLTARQAGKLLGLSIRHVRRLLAAVAKKGLAALAHGNRGRQSPRRAPDALRAHVVTLARTRYRGCNDCHFTQLLAEREDNHISRPTIQRWLRKAGIGSPRRRRPPRHRRRRQRVPQAGLLLQLDGSHHAWLEDRGPRLVLLAAIDDATGRVVGAVFRLQEDAHGYFVLFRQIIRRYGVPVAVYTDRHGIFRPDPNAPLSLEEQLRGASRHTQVGRALRDLGVTWIGAHSPQAKGRIERLFGTFQDRLVIELRLAEARSLADATRVLARFVPRYNARFAQCPADPTPAWRPAPTDLDDICCFKYRRTVQQDNTFPVDGRVFQVAAGPGGCSYAGRRVDVHVHLDGTLTALYQTQRLIVRRLPPSHQAPHCRQDRFDPRRPARDTSPITQDQPTTREPQIPPPNHPWRRPFLLKELLRQKLQAPRVTESLEQLR